MTKKGRVCVNQDEANSFELPFSGNLRYHRRVHEGLGTIGIKAAGHGLGGAAVCSLFSFPNGPVLKAFEKIFPSRQFILDSLRGFGLETGAQRFSHLALDITEGVGVQGLHVSHLLRVFLVWPLILSLSCLRTDPEWDQRVWSPEGHERRPYRVNSALYPPDYPRRKRFGVCWFTFVSASLTPKSQTDNIDGITMTLMLVDKFRSTHHLLCSNLTCPLHCHHSIVIQPTNTGPKTWLLSSQIKDSPECLHGLRHTTTSKRQVWDLFCDFSVLHLTPFLPILSASNYNGAAEYQRGSDSIGFEYWTLRNSRAISQDGNKIWYPPFSFFTLEQKKQTKLKN